MVEFVHREPSPQQNTSLPAPEDPKARPARGLERQE
jgi:hypothetical protein